MFELRERFRFLAPNYKFNPKWKMKIWDGYINLLNANGTIYKGLIHRIEEFCEFNGYEFEDLTKTLEDPISLIEVQDFVETLNLPEKIKMRDYQYDALASAIRKKRMTILSPTGSGKSLIIYSLIRYYDCKTLLIVPKIALTNQMYNDFGDYSKEDEWDVAEQCSKVYGGQDKNNLKQVVVSTWQSLQEMPKDWFDQQGFDLVIVDEAHGAKASEVRKIMEKLNSTVYRFGLTGTLDNVEMNELVITGLFGEVVKVTETSDLIDRGDLSNLRIKCLLLSYSDENRKVKRNYAEEIDFIVTHPRRNKLITNLALSLQGNTLILFNFVEKHGKVLHKMLKEANPDKEIFYISGEIRADTREEIRQAVEVRKKDCIILGSMGTMSMGINITYLHNIIFAHPTKAEIRVLQSIGRGLRKNDEKDECVLFDIADDLKHNSKQNYTMKHFAERLKIYLKSKFPYKIHKIELEK